MFTVANRHHAVQRAICLFLAAFVVSSCLTLGAVGADVVARQAQAAVVVAQV